MKQKRKELNDKIIVQWTIILLISVVLFILLSLIPKEYFPILKIENSKLYIITIISLIIFSFSLIIFSIIRLKEAITISNKLQKTQVEAQKNKSDSFLFLDTLPSIVFLVDKTQRIIWANKFLLQIDKDILGKFPNEIKGFDKIDIQHKLILKSFFSKKMEQSTNFFPATTLFPQDTYLEFYSVPLMDLQQNDVNLLALISVNITGTIQFNESRERLNLIIGVSQDAIFIVDLNQRIVSWNQAAEKIFGYSSKEIIGQPITILDHLIEFEMLVSIFDIHKLEHTHSIKQIELVEIKTKNATLVVDFTIYPFVDEVGTIIGISTIVRDRTEAVKAKQALEISEMQMRQLALHIDAVREEERKSIAFAMHDELGYALSAIKMDISWLHRNLDITNDTVNERIKDMIKLVDLTIKKVKTLSANLRPSILDHFGLIAAIEEQSAEFQRRTGIRCRVNIKSNLDEITFQENIRTPIFRIFQEAQTNITRYAKASRVDVNIDFIDKVFILEVIDNGVGIPEDKITSISSFGLLGIREKAISIGGKATISRIESGGTSVCLEVKI